MFASKGITEHLARGLVGLLAFTAATRLATTHPWLAFAAVGVAFAALRGCPTCWTIGLVQTMVAKVRGRSTEGLCRDGNCALQAPERERNLRKARPEAHA